jgi:hypothetical protein
MIADADRDPAKTPELVPERAGIFSLDVIKLRW